MIRSFADIHVRRLFEDGRSTALRGLDREVALMLLDMLDATPALDPLRALRVAGLHAVGDTTPRRWAMAVNARWRVTFCLREGEAQEVTIEDRDTG